MESRLIFATPEGPMCYVDYETVQEGKSILYQLRQTANYHPGSRSYEFSLFERVRNRLIKKDWFYLPSFDEQCVNLFLESAAS